MMTLVVTSCTSCDKPGDTGAQPERPVAEVIHAATAGQEAAAMRQLASAYERAGGRWHDNPVGGYNNAYAAGMVRIVGNDPPTAMHFGVGREVQNLAEEGMLANVDALARRGQWDRVVTSAVVPALKHDGHYVAVPLSIQGLNWTWFSRRALDHAGVVGTPATWDELFVVLDRLRAAGAVPLATAGVPFIRAQMFASVLLSRGGADLYDRVYRQGSISALRSPEMLDVAQTYARLRAYADPGSPGRSWTDTATMVVNGRAGVMFMGEWAKSAFVAAGQRPGRDFACTIGIGDNPLILGGEVLAFPRTTGREQERARNLLAEVTFSPEAQRRYNDAKGAFSARRDVSTGLVDSCARLTRGRLAADRAVPTPDMYLSPATKGAVSDAISEFWDDRSISPAVFVDRFAAALRRND